MKDSSLFSVRTARRDDVEPIVAMSEPYAQRGLILPRASGDIVEHLDNFLVADADGQRIGCVALRDFGRALEEIRTLIVREDWQGHGVGTMLVRAAMRRARERGTRRLFALTVRPNLFTRLDFVVVPKSRFPAKVWADCRFCKKRDHCDETAVVLQMAPPNDSPDRVSRTSDGPNSVP